MRDSVACTWLSVELSVLVLVDFFVDDDDVFGRIPPVLGPNSVGV